MFLVVFFALSLHRFRSQSNVFCFFKRVKNWAQNKKKKLCNEASFLCFITNSCAATANEILWLFSKLNPFSTRWKWNFPRFSSFFCFFVAQHAIHKYESLSVIKFECWIELKPRNLIANVGGHRTENSQKLNICKSPQLVLFWGHY